MNLALSVWILFSVSGEYWVLFWQIITLLLDQADHLKSCLLKLFGGRCKVAFILGQVWLHTVLRCGLSGPLLSCQSLQQGVLLYLLGLGWPLVLRECGICSGRSSSAPLPPPFCGSYCAHARVLFGQRLQGTPVWISGALSLFGPSSLVSAPQIPPPLLPWTLASVL